MPRKKREVSPTGIYHWISRGINKMPIFKNNTDYKFFKDLILEYKEAYKVSIYHYCLMSNHIHMLLYSETKEHLSSFSHYILRRYAYHYCETHHWSGAVFQKGYIAKPVDKESYLLECARYIERNPIKAGLVKDPEDYPQSSFCTYTKEVKDCLITLSPGYLALSFDETKRGEIYSDYVKAYRPQDEMIQRGIIQV